MKMTRDVILARQLRFAAITNLLGQFVLDDKSAKELLSGPLEPGNNDTIVDDSALLGDAQALFKIQREMQEDICMECGETETVDPYNDGVVVCAHCGTRR